MSSAASILHPPRSRLSHLPRVCTALAGPDAVSMLEKAEAIVRDDPFLEFRLDSLKCPPLAALPKFRHFGQMYPHVVLIATCRRVANGGGFRGSVAAQVEVLTKASASGFQIIDLELQSALNANQSALDKIRSRAALLLSYHDFQGTRKLQDTFDSMTSIEADYYKLVSTANCLYDNVVMMKFLREQSRDHSLIGFCMGSHGMVSRLLAVRAGSMFTFAGFAPGEETAPGQLAARELREVFRIHQVDAATRLYGVAGDPVAQSLSPVMMNAAFKRENVNAIYLPLHAKSMDDLLACVRDLPIAGLSITMPFKEEITTRLNSADSTTQRSGACNTVVRAHEGRLYGFNTDAAGLIAVLESRFALAGCKALVIGAGGAGRAAVFGLKDRGAAVFVMNRTPGRAQKLARQAKARYLSRKKLLTHQFDVVVNATPVGMESEVFPLNASEIRARFVLDMVYGSRETPFTIAARSAGAEVIPGIEMFVQQGARQFEIWTSKPAPASEMFNVVNAAISGRETAGAKSNGG